MILQNSQNLQKSPPKVFSAISPFGVLHRSVSFRENGSHMTWSSWPASFLSQDLYNALHFYHFHQLDTTQKCQKQMEIQCYPVKRKVQCQQREERSQCVFGVMDGKCFTLTLFRYLPLLAYLIWNWRHKKGWFPTESNPGPFAHQSLYYPCQATPVTPVLALYPDVVELKTKFF